MLGNWSNIKNNNSNWSSTNKRSLTQYRGWGETNVKDLLLISLCWPHLSFYHFLWPQLSFYQWNSINANVSLFYASWALFAIMASCSSSVCKRAPSEGIHLVRGCGVNRRAPEAPPCPARLIPTLYKSQIYFFSSLMCPTHLWVDIQTSWFKGAQMHSQWGTSALYWYEIVLTVLAARQGTYLNAAAPLRHHSHSSCSSVICLCSGGWHEPVLVLALPPLRLNQKPRLLAASVSAAAFFSLTPLFGLCPRCPHVPASEFLLPLVSRVSDRSLLQILQNDINLATGSSIPVHMCVSSCGSKSERGLWVGRECCCRPYVGYGWAGVRVPLGNLRKFHCKADSQQSFILTPYVSEHHPQ